MTAMIDWDALAVWVWESLQDASPWLSPILWTAFILLVIILWIRFKGWSKTKAIFEWAHKAIDTVDQVLKIVDDLTYIKGQLTANGGSTVKDQSKISADLARETADKVDRLTATVESTNKIAARAARTASQAKSAAAKTQKILIDHVSATAARAEK